VFAFAADRELVPDGAKNGTETDVDCGGASSPKCAVGKTCLAFGDCASNECYGGFINYDRWKGTAGTTVNLIPTGNTPTYTETLAW
jgi:hypothetical protein